jgi:predicted RNA-binding protein with TRAM domain
VYGLKPTVRSYWCVPTCEFSPDELAETNTEVKRMSFERSFNKPVEQGKEYEVEIKETSRRGDGVARIEGFVVFVPQTKPGDKVKVKINTVGPRFATGEVVQ